MPRSGKFPSFWNLSIENFKASKLLSESTTKLAIEKFDRRTVGDRTDYCNQVQYNREGMAKDLGSSY